MPRDTDPLSAPFGTDFQAEQARERLEQTIRWRAVRVLLMAGAPVFGPIAVCLWLYRGPDATPLTPLPSLMAGLIALISLVSLRGMAQRRDAHNRLIALIVMSLVMALPVAVSIARGIGLHGITLSIMSLMVAFATGLLGRRTGLSFAVLGAAALLGLAAAEALGGWRVSTAPNEDLGLRLSAQLGILALGLAIGLGLLNMVRRSLQEAEERTARFRGLLSMAADWYWEMNSEFRFTQMAEDRPGASGLDLQSRIGRTPWEIDAVGLSDDELDAHRADLESHRPFHGLVARRTGTDGSPRWVSISGEPRFDPHGSFRGYWGVGRDVTREVMAERNVQATETRYLELFRRSPSPLVLHRWGRVIDANPAAMALFGYGQRAGMVGQDLFNHFEPGDDEIARGQAAKLESQPAGAMQPMQDFHLRTLSRRRRLVQATSVRVETATGPATLSFLVDQTEASRAQEALRRSEGLLSHLVATCPDTITLTDAHTGRYAMVNKAYETVTGYSSAEVLGRTALEVGIWQNLDERNAVMDELRRNGQVHNRAVTFRGKSGEGLTMLISLAPFEMDGQSYVVLFARDVTEIERTRLIHAAVLENASIGIALTRDRRFILANPYIEATFGWPDGGLIGQHGSVVWSSNEAWAQVGVELGPRLAAGELVETEREMCRRDGSTFLARLLAKAVDPAHPSRGGTIWIIEDVTERRRTEAALALATEQAQAANRAKSAFLANTSHEIRTPLNGLLGLGRMAQQPDISDQRRREYLDQMMSSAESLAGLISDILDFSKIEAGRLTVDTQAFSLRELLTSMRLAYISLAQAHGLLLSVEIDADLPPWVFGDPMRTRQIIANYLGNALKFTEEGSIRLSVQCCPGPGERVRLTVTDTGPGIAPELHARLFQPFTQADESTTRRFGGTGLGLSICRELAELMGGHVGVHSSPGQGASFWAELPFPAAPAPLIAQPLAHREQGNLKGLRVLLAEDHPVNMLIAVAQLEQWGLQVEQAADGLQAIEAVRAAASSGQPFNIVLMDVQMPVMGGYEATRELRREFSAEQLPIVALTAAALVSERDEALAAGMNAFLTKPIDAPKLHETLLRLTQPRPA